MIKLAVAVALVGGCGTKTTASGEGEAAPFVAAAREELVGHRAPAVALEMLDGSRVELAQVIGKRPVYLKFWATWCVPCREQMPHLEATFRKYGDRLAMFAVDVAMEDPIENVRAMVAEKQLTVPVAIDRDGSVSAQYYLNVTPQHVVIDRAGVVRFVGHAVTPELERAIASVVEPGSPSAPVESAPPPPVADLLPPLALDDGTTLALESRPHTPIALTFATLFCDSYIANSRPEIGAACAADAKRVEQVRRAHPALAWVVVAYPVWTGADDLREFHARLDVHAPVGIDRGNAWFRHFGVRSGYTTILIGSDGRELGRAGGDGVAALIDKSAMK